MKITLNHGKVIGKIKPLHGVGQPPFLGTNFEPIKYLKDAGIPYSRLHDVGGAYGQNRYVDVPNIFRDFDKDPYNEDNYDFAFTDLLIEALVENGVEPFFRLGVTIENACKVRAYNIHPPKDFKKWAIICEHIIRHYTEGWASGYNYGIKYWEIWNEPDNFEDIYENQMWRGTKEEFYELYKVASKHLKSCFPHLKIGGYGSCGFYSIMNSYVVGANSSPRYDYFIIFFDGFIDYIKKEGCPLDFFSWHTYDTVEKNIEYAKYARERLDAHGFEKTEITVNEWNPDLRLWARGTCYHAANTLANMLSWQNLPVDSAMFYDARIGISVCGSMFNPLTREPYPTYYAFTAFNRLYALKNQISISGCESGIYAVAAESADNACLVIANTNDAKVPLELQSSYSVKKAFLTAENCIEKEISLPDVLEPYGILTVILER